MAALSPSTWIVAGTLIAIVSWLMPQLRIFVFVGVLFLVVGFVKLLLARKRNGPVVGQGEDLYHRDNKKKRLTAERQGAKSCFVCSATNSVKANFCGHCGHKLR